MIRIAMIRQSSCAMFSLVFLVVVAWATMAFADDADTAEGDIRRHLTFEPLEQQLTTGRPPAGVTRARSLFLPAAISERDLDRYARILNLSEAQANFLAMIYAKYVEENAALKEERLMALWRHSADVAAKGGQFMDDPEVAREQAALYAHRNDYVRRMAAIEQRMFDQMEANLTDDQRRALHRVKMLRARERTPSKTAAFDGAAIDLTEIIDRLERRGDMIITNPSLLAVEVVRYEQQLTSLKERHWNARLDTITRGVELLAQMNTSAEASVRDELRNARATILRREARLEMELLELNERALDRFAAHLDEQSADMLRSAFLAAAYPRFFPDYHDARDVIDHALSLEILADEVRQAMQTIAVRYEQERNRLNREMIQLTREYGEYIAMTRRSGGQTEASYMANLNNRRELRAAGAERALREIVALLPAEYEVMLAEKLDSYRKRLENLPEHIYQPEIVIQRH